MNDLIIFNHEELGEVRVFERDGQYWFVGRDVATILGYANTKDALISHVDEEDKDLFLRSENATLEIPNRGLTIINESGLYALIFGSKLPKAKEFKRWVTSEVLPSIRKQGCYIANQPPIQTTEQTDLLVNNAVSQITEAIKKQLPSLMDRTIKAEDAEKLLLSDKQLKITPREKDEIAFWEEFLAEWRSFRKYLPNKRDADRAFLKLYNERHPKANVGIRTLYRKWNAYCDGGAKALIDGRGKHGNHVKKIDKFPPELVLQIEKVIEKMHKEQALNFSEISRFCEDNGINVSSSTIRRYYEKGMLEKNKTSEQPQ